MKQTAVEWLIDQYELTIGKSITAVMIDEIATAKEMEKEYLIDFYVEGCDETYGVDEPATSTSDIDFGEEYYNKTFKNK